MVNRIVPDGGRWHVYEDDDSDEIVTCRGEPDCPLTGNSALFCQSAGCRLCLYERCVEGKWITVEVARA